MARKKAPLTLRRLLHPHNLCPVKMNSCYHGLFTERIFVGNCLWFCRIHLLDGIRVIFVGVYSLSGAVRVYFLTSVAAVLISKCVE